MAVSSQIAVAICSSCTTRKTQALTSAHFYQLGLGCPCIFQHAMQLQVVPRSGSRHLGGGLGGAT